MSLSPPGPTKTSGPNHSGITGGPKIVCVPVDINIYLKFKINHFNGKRPTDKNETQIESKDIDMFGIVKLFKSQINHFNVNSQPDKNETPIEYKDTDMSGIVKSLKSKRGAFKFKSIKLDLLNFSNGKVNPLNSAIKNWTVLNFVFGAI